MGEIDIIKLDKKIKREALKSFMTKTTAPIYIVTSLTQIPYILSNINSPTLFFNTFLLGASISILHHIWYQKTEFEFQIRANIIRDTKEYQECLKEYNELLLSIASLIKESPFKNLNDVISYLQILLKTGCFNAGKTITNDSYKNEKESVLELTGARIVTGTGVCRHYSSFMADVLNTIGFASSVKPVITISGDKKITSKYPNHAIILTTDGTHITFYDPTISRFLDLRKDLKHPKYKIATVDDKRYYINLEMKYPNLISEPIERLLNELEYTSYPETNELEYMGKILMKHCYEIPSQRTFMTNEKERLNKIKELIEKINPCSDEKISSWKLTK